MLRSRSSFGRRRRWHSRRGTYVPAQQRAMRAHHRLQIGLPQQPLEVVAVDVESFVPSHECRIDILRLDTSKNLAIENAF